MYPTRSRYPRRRSPLPAEGRRCRGDAGASTVEVLSWAAMSTVAIVVIGAALQALGVEIVDYVRSQLGL